MNITYLLTQDLKSPSGLGRYGPIASQMAGSGHNVTVFALHPDIRSLKERTSSSNGLTVSYVAAMHVQKSGSDKTYYSPAELVRVASNATWALTRAGLSIQADIIHICKPHPMNGVAGLVAKYARGTHLVLDCDDYEAGSGHFESPWQRRLVAYFERTLPRKVKHVTTNTSFMRENILSWGVPQERITYLPNGVDRERFRHSERNHTNQIRDQYDLIDREVISYIGSMSLASHAVDLLLEAFKKLKSLRPNAVLLLVGGGEDFTKLQQAAQATGLAGDIHFTGRIPPDEIPDYYRISDVSVDPVYDDQAARGRSPLKLFESWACGVPIVTADVGDRKSLLSDPPAGLLSRAGDADSLARSIDRILENPSLADSLRSNGLIQVEQYYWDVLAKRLENIYHAITA